MKKALTLLITLLLAFLTFACANTNGTSKVGKGKNVSAIFVGIYKQPSGGPDDLIDTI